ncbi:hypothetical protein C8R46DRAFT_1082028, partial [Mycena filopes]
MHRPRVDRGGLSPAGSGGAADYGCDPFSHRVLAGIVIKALRRRNESPPTRKWSKCVMHPAGKKPCPQICWVISKYSKYSLKWPRNCHTPLGVGGRWNPRLAGQDCARGVHFTPIPSRCGRAAGGRQGRYDSGCRPQAVERRCATPARAVGAAGGRARSGASTAPRALDALAPPKSVGPVSDCTRTSAIKLDEGVQPTCSFYGDGFLLVLGALVFSLALLKSLCSLRVAHRRVLHRRVILAGPWHGRQRIIALCAHVPVLLVVGSRVLLSSKSPCDPLKIFHTVVVHVLCGSTSPDVLAIASEPENSAPADS